MADINFPNISDPHPEYFSEKIWKPAHRTDMSAGRVISRPKFSGALWQFTLGWDMLPDAEYDLLCEFFINYQGQVFNWTHFRKGTSHECIFLDDEFPEAEPHYLHWSIKGVRIGER